MGVVVLAWAGQWALSIIMLVILVLVAIVLYVWAKKG
jgi:ABC-type multidrug transport system fused ATPase/permease subunit